MKLLRNGLIAGLSVVSFALYAPHAVAATGSAADADGNPQLVTELVFKAAAPMAATTAAIASEVSVPSGWTLFTQPGGQIGVQATTSPDGTGVVYALEGSYPIPTGGGAMYVGANYNISSLNTESVYIEFWAKMPGAKEGCKFVKIFGARSAATGYADTTIYTDYTGAAYGAIRQIGFGDGGGLINDSSSIIDLTGLHSSIGRSAGIAVVKTPQASVFSAADWGTSWHHFRIHVKFNSGTTTQNEVPDGEYYLEIDGKVYVDATGLYNRNPANGPIAKIGFFGWAQTESQPFQLWYDDIRISTGGFMSSVLPEPPADAAVK